MHEQKDTTPKIVSFLDKLNAHKALTMLMDIYQQRSTACICNELEALLLFCY